MGVETTHLERAKSLFSVIRENAERTEADSTLAPDVVLALQREDLFWMIVPQELGGGGLGLAQAIEVIEELTRADGSTGWAFMANSLTLGFCAGYLPPEGVAEAYKDRNAIGAGMAAPAGAGRKVPGGYRVSGRYRFASGSGHANWMTVGFVLMGADGAPLMGPDGIPEMRLSYVPMKDITLCGNWNVTGLKGTGSYDYEVNDLFVPEHMACDMPNPKPYSSDTVYAAGVWGLALMGHSGVALGLMRAALEQVAAITDGKERGGYPVPVSEYPVFLSEFSKHEALFQAARALVYDVYGNIDETARAGRQLSDEQQARLRQVPTWVTHIGDEVVRFCHLWGGTQSLKLPSLLARISLDAAATTQHLLVDPITMVDSGRPLHRMWADTAHAGT